MKRICRASGDVEGSGCWTCKYFRVQRRGLSGACNHDEVDFDGVRHECPFHEYAPSLSDVHEEMWRNYEDKNIIQKIVTPRPPSKDDLLDRLKNKDDVVVVCQR